jgi:endonuclease/exonuclease/phosphatase family metal-dependent hydrolase
MGRELADELGYSLVEHKLAECRRAGPHPGANHRWMRRFRWISHSHALYLSGERSLPGRVRRSARFREAEPGSWGLALLSRVPILDVAVIDLGRLGLDRARRATIVASIAWNGRPIYVAATHMPHLIYGSPVTYARLSHQLRALGRDRLGVLAGDFNLWGPPAEALLPDWRRAIKGKTWPAWRPNSHVDHVMVTPGWKVLGGQVLPDAGSDHRPVRVRLAPA